MFTTVFVQNCTEIHNVITTNGTDLAVRFALLAK